MGNEEDIFNAVRVEIYDDGIAVRCCEAGEVDSIIHGISFEDFSFVAYKKEENTKKPESNDLNRLILALASNLHDLEFKPPTTNPITCERIGDNVFINNSEDKYFPASFIECLIVNKIYRSLRQADRPVLISHRRVKFLK